MTEFFLQVNTNQVLPFGKDLGLAIACIPILPLLSFVLLGLFGRKYLKDFSGVIGTIVLLTVTVLSFIAAFQYFFVDGRVNGVYQSIIPAQYHWLQFSPSLSIDMGIVLDPISVMMLLIVSFVSLMVHIFSLGYMKGEERFSTYYAFLSLFTFSMLGLVVSTNIFQIYIFWELVGISSYLLIGFYFDKPSAVAASKKAFIVTRFADLGFLIGILILAFDAGTLDFHTLIQRLTTAQSPQFISITTSSFFGVSMLTWALTLVFIGGAGKSAMFPLHIWLPDAMEGPTPVSALIHAATMVVAGVYLVARLFPLYSIDVIVLNLVAYVGAISALLAAVIACTQTDIKRVLAYSTISQIGYMMFALGVSRNGGEQGLGYMASMFHLFTHAFFKSLLFLCAGAVIHVVHSNEMNDMGGLRKLMPLTHIAFLIACLAIAGIPPFSGFFSKEEILTAAYHSNKFIYGMGVFTSMLTAFYMFRLYFMIFHNKQSPVESRHGEGSLSMKFPLAVLAICTAVAGLVPFGSYVTSDGVPFATHVDIIFSILPVMLSVAAILFASKLYYRQNELPGKIASSLGTLYHAAYSKFYVDEVYLFIAKKIIFNLVGKPAAWIDKHIVDGFMNLLATITGKISAMIKELQSGKVQAYALYFFGGIVGLTVLFIYLWK
jgi:NADH-quinone oxidoreductase subunit L